MVNVADLSLSLKVPVNIRATKYIYGTKTYTYDSTNRLTSVMRGVLEEDRFRYDGVGNRLTDIQQQSYTYNNGNELLSYGNVGQGFSLAYDANGNMVSKTDSNGTTSYVYDSENRLIELRTPNAQLVTYKYDPFGRRIEKNVNGVVTRYVYDREDILFELDGAGNIVTEYFHGPGIDEPIAMIKNNQTYYYHADGLGSIIAITDSAGRVVQRYEYDSFGVITYTQDSNFVQPYTYTGREYDTESGLYYYRARYYDAKIGRFLQQDPIGFRGGINKFAYVGNSPLNWIDPRGLFTVQIGVNISGGAGKGGTGGGGVAFGYSENSGFQFGTYEYVGGGGYGGVGGSGSFEVSVSGNTNINQLGGSAGSVGGSAGEGIVGGVEVNIMQGAKPSYTGSIGYGGGTPVELHGFYTYTWVQEWWQKKNKPCNK